MGLAHGVDLWVHSSSSTWPHTPDPAMDRPWVPVQFAHRKTSSGPWVPKFGIQDTMAKLIAMALEIIAINAANAPPLLQVRSYHCYPVTKLLDPIGAPWPNDMGPRAESNLRPVDWSGLLYADLHFHICANLHMDQNILCTVWVQIKALRWKHFYSAWLYRVLPHMKNERKWPRDLDVGQGAYSFQVHKHTISIECILHEEKIL